MLENTGPTQPVFRFGVAHWHALLRLVASANIVLWCLSALPLVAGRLPMHSPSYADGLLQLLLSAGYVFGCAFRSWWPVYDIPRIVMVESRCSSIFVGRSIATVAELCFAMQWALILRRFGSLGPSELANGAALAIAPLIVVAECASWYAVLTTSQRGHVLENSLWGLSAALAVAGMLVIGPSRLTTLYPPAIIWCLGGVVYVSFMFLSDVPMYWSRWIADQAGGRQYLTLAQGSVEVCRRRVVSKRWEDWRSEVLWMSLYFSLGVWSSISLVYASFTLAAQR